MKKTLMDYRDFYRRELLEDVMPFWMRSDLLDREYGGCITSVDRAGRSYNDDKSVWFQGRCLWTFSALCRQYGEQKAWREGAELARRFLEGHCVDHAGRTPAAETAVSVFRELLRRRDGGIRGGLWGRRRAGQGGSLL